MTSKESRPSRGARAAGRPEALVTRSRADNARLGALLRAAGVPVVGWATTCVRLVVPEDGREGLREAVRGADVVVFSSRRGVLALRALLGRGTATLLAARRVAAVGVATAAALERLGVRCTWCGGAGAEALGAELAGALPRGTRVLLARGAEAADAPVGALRERGLVVDDRRVYRHVTPPRPECPPRRFGAVACASPSAARRVLEWHPWIAASPFVAIGATTAAELERRGVRPAAIAERPTNEALARAVLGVLDLDRTRQETP